MRAMVVDDSKAMRAILRGILKELRFETSEAKNGAEALAALQTNGPVDLVLVDWHMPEMDGPTFVRAVRERPAFKGMRLVMVTSESEAPLISQALEAGADEYVMKPFSKESLLSKLEIVGFRQPES